MTDSNEPLTLAELYYSDPVAVTDTYRPSIGESVDQIRDRTGMNEADSAALLNETSQFFHGANIRPEQAVGLHSLIVKHLKEPASEAIEKEWATESRRLVREKYGEDGVRRLAAVKQFVNSYSALDQQVNASGVGSHPTFVLAMVDRANNLRPRRK